MIVIHCGGDPTTYVFWCITYFWCEGLDSLALQLVVNQTRLAMTTVSITPPDNDSNCAHTQRGWLSHLLCDLFKSYIDAMHSKSAFLLHFSISRWLAPIGESETLCVSWSEVTVVFGDHGLFCAMACLWCKCSVWTFSELRNNWALIFKTSFVETYIAWYSFIWTQFCNYYHARYQARHLYMLCIGQLQHCSQSGLVQVCFKPTYTSN